MLSGCGTEAAAALALDLAYRGQSPREATTLSCPLSSGPCPISQEIQIYWAEIADSDEHTTYIVQSLLPHVSNPVVHAALLALVRLSSVTLLLKKYDGLLSHGELEEFGQGLYHQAVGSAALLTSKAHQALMNHMNLPAVPRLYVILLDAELRCKQLEVYRYPCMLQLLDMSASIQCCLSQRHSDVKQHPAYQVQSSRLAVAVQGDWLDAVLQLLRVSQRVYARRPHTADDLSCLLDNFLGNISCTKSSGPKLSLVGVLYECAVSPMPVDYGPIAAKAMLNICQDTCGQLASSGSAATALRITRLLANKQQQLPTSAGRSHSQATDSSGSASYAAVVHAPKVAPASPLKPSAAPRSAGTQPQSTVATGPQTGLSVVGSSVPAGPSRAELSPKPANVSANNRQDTAPVGHGALQPFVGQGSRSNRVSADRGQSQAHRPGSSMPSAAGISAEVAESAVAKPRSHPVIQQESSARHHVLHGLSGGIGNGDGVNYGQSTVKSSNLKSWSTTDF
ncbi:hypothetical protein WJX79_007218 [Trebouxia sp. C0005]